MRYMVIIKSTGHREAGIPARTEYVRAVSAYRRSLAEAGILMVAEELLPSSSGARISYRADGNRPRVQSGPFPADGGLVAEYAVIEVASMDEALRWALRMPVPVGLGDYEIELRRLREHSEIAMAPIDSALEEDLQNHLHMFQNHIKESI